MKNFLLNLFLLFSFSISAQINGIVKDSLTKMPIQYANIWIENETNGKPQLNLSDNVKNILNLNELDDYDVSLSHHEDYAIANVILFKN